MQAEQYFLDAVQKLASQYEKSEAENIMNWVFEDVLMIKKVHLKIFDKEISFAEELKLESIMQRLVQGEPIQYVLGYAYFMDLVLEVNKHVLIPRPETEELVNWVLIDYKENKSVNSEKKENASVIEILDICTGSACIALALKQSLPLAEITAIDVSEGTLEVAAKNSKILDLPIRLKQLDVLSDDGITWLKQNNAQLWVCNPPYISNKERSAMHQNVLKFEPHLALFVGDDDPLLFYRVISDAFLLNKNASHLYFEISEYQKEGLTKMLEGLSLPFTIRKDLQCKDRMLKVSKK